MIEKDTFSVFILFQKHTRIQRIFKGQRSTSALSFSQKRMIISDRSVGMEEDKFNFLTEQFDDIKILRYQVPAFGQLPLREKIFVYYLSQAALAGRDILWDQNNRYNLRIRKILERIVREYPGDRKSVV